MVGIFYSLIFWLISNCFLLETPTTVDLLEDTCDDDLPGPFINISTINNEVPDTSTPAACLKQFQLENIYNDNHPQRIFLSRMDGVNELKNDIISLYKSPSTSLRVVPRVRFEDESAVGSGPIREFLSLAMKILEEGIDDPATSKATLFFECEEDHRIPVHNQCLRLTGMFRTLGRILGHSLLHGGQGMYGISPAVKEYLASDVNSIDIQTLPVTIEDLPDIDLRNVLLEVLIVITRAVRFQKFNIGSGFWAERMVQCSFRSRTDRNFRLTAQL